MRGSLGTADSRGIVVSDGHFMPRRDDLLRHEAVTRRASEEVGRPLAEPDGSGLIAIVADGPTELPPFEIDAGGRSPGRRGP